MARLFNRRQLANILYYTGALHIAGLVTRHFGQQRPVFLAGHRVLPDEPADGRVSGVDATALRSGHAITTAELDCRIRYLRWLLPAGNPSCLADGMPQSRAFFLTFDDDYRDNLANAGPVVRRHDLIRYNIPDSRVTRQADCVTMVGLLGFEPS